MIRTETVEPKPNGIAARAMAARNHSGVPVNIVRMDGGTQSRAMLQDGVIEEYADAIKSGVEFPPIVIFYDGSDHWLADGFHRIRAFVAAGRETIPADVRQGTRRDAILHSVGANETHGLRRTNEDKRRAVLTLLNDGEWSKWPQTRIAEACAVSQQYVSKIAGTLPDDASYNKSKTRSVERNGKSYTMNTSAIGKSAPKDDDMDFEADEDENAETASVGLARNKHHLPEGLTFDELARQGMAREAKGENAKDIAKSFGIGVHYFRAASDVTFLFDRGGYSEADAAIVNRAFRLLVDEQKVFEAREAINPVAMKVWGDERNTQPRADREPARVDQFEHAFGIVMQTCATAAELDFPYLTADEIKTRVKEIKTARRHLLLLLTRMEEFHNA